jgi:hypothetical protein
MITYDYKAKLSDYDPTGRDIYHKQYDESGKITENISFYTNTNKAVLFKYNKAGLLAEVESQSPKGVFFEKLVNFYDDAQNCNYSVIYNQQNKSEVKYRYITSGNECKVAGTDSTESAKKPSESWIADFANLTEEHLFSDSKDVLIKKEIIVYNESFMPVKKTFIHISFSQHAITEYIYDNEGRLILEKTLDKNNVVKKTKDYIYENKLLPKESFTKDAEGKPISKDVYYYEFYQ